MALRDPSSHRNSGGELRVRRKRLHGCSATESSRGGSRGRRGARSGAPCGGLHDFLNTEEEDGGTAKPPLSCKFKCGRDVSCELERQRGDGRAGGGQGEGGEACVKPMDAHYGLPYGETPRRPVDRGERGGRVRVSTLIIVSVEYSY